MAGPKFDFEHASVSEVRHCDLQETRQSGWQRMFHAPLDSFRGRLGRIARD